MWRNLLTAKFPYGEISLRWNLFRANFCYNEISLGKISHNEISYVEIYGGGLFVRVRFCAKFLSVSPTLVAWGSSGLICFATSPVVSWVFFLFGFQFPARRPNSGADFGLTCHDSGRRNHCQRKNSWLRICRAFDEIKFVNEKTKIWNFSVLKRELASPCEHPYALPTLFLSYQLSQWKSFLLVPILFIVTCLAFFIKGQRIWVWLHTHFGATSRC